VPLWEQRPFCSVHLPNIVLSTFTLAKNIDKLVLPEQVDSGKSWQSYPSPALEDRQHQSEQAPLFA